MSRDQSGRRDAGSALLRTRIRFREGITCIGGCSLGNLQCALILRDGIVVLVERAIRCICIGDAVRHLTHCRDAAGSLNCADLAIHETLAADGHGRIGVSGAVIFPRVRVGRQGDGTRSDFELACDGCQMTCSLIGSSKVLLMFNVVDLNNFDRKNFCPRINYRYA